tara:strand:+ start:3008 stop:4225 length:1218 start_codon:yes stop_codon:yes gene_type:complete
LTKNKKILIVTECFYPEEFRINELAFFWKKKGYEIDVLTLVPTYPHGKVFPNFKNKLFQKDKHLSVNIYRVFAITGYKDNLIKKILKYLNFMFLASITAVLIGKRYEYIFGFNMSALTNMLPVVIIKKLYKKRSTLWVQDLWPGSLYSYGFKKNKFSSFIIDKFVKYIYQNTDSIVISSKGFKKALIPYLYKNCKLHYLPNWADELNINSHNIAKKKNIFKKAINFTFAGNIGKFQNLENIIKAFTLMHNDYQKKSRLNIIGDGSNLDNLKLLAKNNPYIYFYGRQPSKIMGNYYQSSDFLIISLVSDPLFSVLVPSKMQTYIAAKKPILAIIKGDTADIVKKYNLGICSDPSNINDITNMFEKCIKMKKDDRKKFIKQNDLLLSSIFNREKIIDSMLKIVTKNI